MTSVGIDGDAGILDLLLDLRTTFDHNALSRSQSQQIAAKIVIFLVSALNKLDSLVQKILTEEYGHIFGINHSLICIDKADNTHEMQTTVLTVTVRHGDNDIFVYNVFGQLLELPDTFSVGAVAKTDGHGFSSIHKTSPPSILPGA